MRLLVVFALLFAASVIAEPVEYSLPDMSGKMHALADYKGKWVIVNYWATWCPPCQEEILDLVSFHDSHKDTDAVVLGINLEDVGQEQLESFVDSFMISYPILRSEPLTTTPLRPVPNLPTTYIVTPNRSPITRQIKPVTSKQLEDYIASKKKQKTASR